MLQHEKLGNVKTQQHEDSLTLPLRSERIVKPYLRPLCEKCGIRKTELKHATVASVFPLQDGVKKQKFQSIIYQQEPAMWKV